MYERYQIELLGGLTVRSEEHIITRFSTRKTAALLAYLAYFRERRHSREVLIADLWPDCELVVGRNRLSVSLSSLRHQLEPLSGRGGMPAGTVIFADRATVGLNPAAVTTDVAQFEVALQAAASACGSSAERVRWLAEAVDLYRGPLLPGYYEEWIVPEQQRLAGQFIQALSQLIQCLERQKDRPQALEYALHAVAAEPLQEEIHHELIRLYAAAGQPAAALQQYRQLEQLLQEELGLSPSEATRQLVRQIQNDRERRDAAAEIAPSPPRFSPPPPQGGSSPPAGTVTFLLTELDQAAHLGELPGEAATTVFERYHSLLHEVFRRHGGCVVKAVDHSLVAAFATSSEGLAGAIAGQRAVTSERLNVRLALHTGDAPLHEGEYQGPVLRDAGRILGAAHGGQILCSEMTAGLLRRAAPGTIEPAVQFTDLGVYRLHAGELRERLFQIDYPGMPQRQFPPLNAEAGYPSRLPLRVTRFFGRQAELAQLRRLLLAPEIRLVTLTGPGGSGKTRLALEAAGQVAEALQEAAPPHSEGPWFVPLADVRDPGLILDAIRTALRLPAAPQLTPMEQLVTALADQRTLLVLDNFEQLVEGGTPLLRSLLDQIPTLTCLVTSRQRLDLAGEQEIEVLPLPTPVGAAGPEQLTLYESVQLFVDRAQATRPDFQVTNNNAAMVAALCARLEGIPLALELAATRAKVLTPQQMLVQLEHRFDFLVSRRPEAVARHRTLRAAIDWSYQLLSPELQRCFARLSVFRGGWTLEAAAAIWEGGGGSRSEAVSNSKSEIQNPKYDPSALDDLVQLRECSLLVADEQSSGMRYRMLDTLREFAAEQLVHPLRGYPEEKALLEEQHARYYLSLALEAEYEWDRLEPEQENFRAAEAWLLEHDPPLALRLAEALSAFRGRRGLYAEGCTALSRAVERAVEAPLLVRAEALRALGKLTIEQGNFLQAKEPLEEALALSRQLGDRRRIAHDLCQLCWLPDAMIGKARKRACGEEALSICQELGDPGGIAQVLFFLGRWEECLEIQLQLGDKRDIARALNNAAIRVSQRGEYDKARRMFEESMAMWRELGNLDALRYPLIHLAHVACRQGQLAEARAHLKESLAMCRQRGEKRLIVECLEGLAEVALAEGQWEPAARLLEAGASLREAIGWPVEDGKVEEYDHQVSVLREAMGEHAFIATWAAGAALPWLQAADYGLAV